MAKTKDSSPSKTISAQRLKQFLRGRNLLVTGLIMIVVIQFIQLQRVSGGFSFLEGRDSSLIGEIGELRETYQKIGNDLNQVRQYLRLPTADYNDVEVSEKTENRLEIAIFEYVEYLAMQQSVDARLKANRQMLASLADDTELQNLIKTKGLILQAAAESEEEFFVILESADMGEVARYSVHKNNGKLYLKTALAKEELEYESKDDFLEAAREFVVDEYESLEKEIQKVTNKKNQIVAIVNNQDVQTISLERGLTIHAQPAETDIAFVYQIANQYNEVVGEIVLEKEDAQIYLADKYTEGVKVLAQDLSVSLPKFLRELDPRGYLARRVGKVREQIEGVFHNRSFRTILGNAGLKLAENPREDEQRVYYDIFNSADVHLSSIVLEKATGIVNITNPDGTGGQNILLFDPEFKKKTLMLPDVIPEYGDEAFNQNGTLTVLLAGRQGSNVDTMIFAHINEETGKVRMVSIPRDLYFNGRKINSYYAAYGLPEMVRVLEDISGYNIDKYALIDMYAFSDVVDLIGGIDITLDKPLIDPTYRVVDNGVEGTLHYEPGDYHLGGIQALRIARSRYTSSDFSRSERQQMILKAIQEKARSLGLNDIETIYELAKIILSKVETNVKFDEAIAYYFRYQNFEIESTAVISSGNVLESPPYVKEEDCNELVQAAELAGQPTPECVNENHAYTLVPREDNWNLIKWFFKEQFES